MVRNVLEINPREIVEQSMAMLNEAIRLYRETGDQLGAARALWGLGTAQYFSEDWPVAVDTFRAAEEALSASDDEFMQGWVLHMLGTTEIRLGQLDSALGHIRGALVNMRAAGETTGLVLVLDDFADYAAAIGDIPRSLRLIGAGRALEDATGTGLAAATEEVMRRERYREALGSGGRGSPRRRRPGDEPGRGRRVRPAGGAAGDVGHASASTVRAVRAASCIALTIGLTPAAVGKSDVSAT